jgi:hypothetical protein
MQEIPLEASSRDDRKRPPCLGGKRGDKGFREISCLMFAFTIFLHVIVFILYVLHVLDTSYKILNIFDE